MYYRIVVSVLTERRTTDLYTIAFNARASVWSILKPFEMPIVYANDEYIKAFGKGDFFIVEKFNQPLVKNGDDGGDGNLYRVQEGNTIAARYKINADLNTALKNIVTGNTASGSGGTGGSTTNGDGFLCRFLPKSLQKYCTGESGMFTKIKWIAFAVGGIILYKMTEKK